MKNIFRTLWIIMFVLFATEVSVPVMYGAVSKSKKKATSKKTTGKKKKGKKKTSGKKSRTAKGKKKGKKKTSGKKSRTAKGKKKGKKKTSGKKGHTAKGGRKPAVAARTGGHAPHALGTHKPVAGPKPAEKKEARHPASLQAIIAQDIEGMLTDVSPHMLRFGVFMKLQEEKASWRTSVKLWISGNQANLERVIMFMDQNFVKGDIAAIQRATHRLLNIIQKNWALRSFVDAYLKRQGFTNAAKNEVEALSHVLASCPLSYEHIAKHFDRVEQLLRSLPDMAPRFSKQQIVAEGVKVLYTLADDKRLDMESQKFVKDTLIPQVLASA